MITHSTSYGSLCIGAQEALFQRALEMIIQAREHSPQPLCVGLTGGSTPKTFYAWAACRPLAVKSLRRGGILWSTSDERFVPLDDPESNFGNADRLMLTPLRIADSEKLPWPVDREPLQAARLFNAAWQTLRGEQTAFDLCFLGMGDDAHTASIFPGSPLIDGDEAASFVAIETPEQGWRLTITPAGLSRCQCIIVMVTGASKAGVLSSVLEGDDDPKSKPIQWLKNCAPKVTWLVDTDAAKELTL